MSATMQLRAESVNETERSVEAVLATENPVIVFDWQRYELVDEILLMSGVQMRDQIPLLNDHRRVSLDDVFGSIRNMSIQGSNLICRLYFADMSDHADDPEASKINRAWTKVKQRHQREVSVGYRVLESVLIGANETQIVNGRKYTAGNRPLRIATKWLPREGSLTPIAADMAATTRKENDSMNPLLQYLSTIGLRADATMSEAWQFVAGLTEASQRAEVKKILAANTNLTPDSAARTAMQSWDAQASNQTASQTDAQPESQTSQDGGQRAETRDIAAEVQSALAAERQRAATVQRLFRDSGVDNAPLMERAIAEGWDQGRVAQELLPLVRQRSQPVDNSGHLGIHTVRQADQNSVALAIMLRNGAIALDSPAFEQRNVRQSLAGPHGVDGTRSQPSSVLALDINSDARQRAMDDAHRLASRYSHMLDLAELALRACGLNVPHDREEMARSAVSSSQVQAIFTTDINARLLASYALAPDTTLGWVREEDRDDFNLNEIVTVNHFNGLTVHSVGKEADHMYTDAEVARYRLYRLTGQFVIDEMDFINNRFGNLQQQTPEMIGAIARTIRPNMVYSQILANPTLNGAAVFAAARGNYVEGSTTALDPNSLADMAARLRKIRMSGQPLNLALRYLVGPVELDFTMRQLINSSELRDTTASTNYGTSNPHNSMGYIHRVDDRLGAAGCVDPITGTTRTGSATNWFGFVDPSAGLGRSLVVGYRRGTGRQPQLRNFMRTQGTWGMGWDINMDIGCAWEDYRGAQKSKGAA